MAKIQLKSTRHCEVTTKASLIAYQSLRILIDLQLMFLLFPSPTPIYNCQDKTEHVQTSYKFSEPFGTVHGTPPITWSTKNNPQLPAPGESDNTLHPASQREMKQL